MNLKKLKSLQQSLATASALLEPSTSIIQLQILIYIGLNPKCTPTAVAKALKIPKITVSQQFNKRHSSIKTLVTKELSKFDRRERSLELNRAGRIVIKMNLAK